MKRWLVVLFFLGGGLFAAGRMPSAKAGMPAYETAALDRHDVTAHVTTTGTLAPVTTVTIGTQASGTIASLAAQPNDHVEKGEVLAQLDTALLQAALVQANAGKTQARATVEIADAKAKGAAITFDRETKLYAAGVAAKVDLDSAESAKAVADATLAASKASLAIADAQVRQAAANVGYATIVSPVDGVVLTRPVDVGQTVAGALQTPTLYTVAQDLDHMQIKATVSEGDIGKLADGMKATFTVPAFPNRRFDATVHQVRYAATTTSNVVTYDVVLDVVNPGSLRPGMTATIDIVVATARNAIAVPIDAFRFDPSGKARTTTSKSIYVLRSGKPVEVKVTRGIGDGAFVTIDPAALAQGDVVVIGIEGQALVTVSTSRKNNGMPPGPPPM